LIGVGVLILLGRVFLKEPEETLLSKFPVQPPALQDKGAAPGIATRPEQAVKAPLPENTQPPSTQDPSSQESRKALAEKPPSPAPAVEQRPPAQGKKPSLLPGGTRRPHIQNRLRHRNLSVRRTAGKGRGPG